MSFNSHLAVRGGRTDLAAYSLSSHQPVLKSHSIPNIAGRDEATGLYQIPGSHDASLQCGRIQIKELMTPPSSVDYARVLPPILPSRESSIASTPRFLVDHQRLRDETRLAADSFAIIHPSTYARGHAERGDFSFGLGSSHPRATFSSLCSTPLSSQTDASSCNFILPRAPIAGHPPSSGTIRDFPITSATHVTSDCVFYSPQHTGTFDTQQILPKIWHIQATTSPHIACERNSASPTASDSLPSGPPPTQGHSDLHVGHSLEKKHKCDYCAQAFSRRADRYRHERMHTGEKPYVCSQCKKGFMRSDALSRHQVAEPKCGR